MNSIGRIFRLTDYGESHGKAIGGVIDGVPAGFRLDTAYVQDKVDMRRPGINPLTSPRRERDIVQWLSGIDGESVTLGTPVGFVVCNEDVRSADYEQLRHAYRPGHADFTTEARYGLRDYRGGGRASARQTLCRVVAGAVAMQFLADAGVELRAFISGIGTEEMASPYQVFPTSEAIRTSPVYCPDAATSGRIVALLREEIVGRESIGGRVSLICRGMEAGIGSPVYGRLNARLAAAMMSINASRGIEFGLGMESARRRGRDAVDEYLSMDGTGRHRRVHTASNMAGGIEGGITNGEDICFSVAFKPTPTRPYAVESLTDEGESVTVEPRGRHDPCVAIRAVPVVEAMAAIVLLDELLLSRCARW